MKVLNLFSGLGGNRKLWPEGTEVTAVEYDPEIAKFYQQTFPNDRVLVGDANRFLEEHYYEFDFIWSSPPCQTHSQYRHNVGVLGKGFKPLLPDASLYSQIVFLKTYFQGAWVVENVRPYYEYLIKPSAYIQRHPFWSNFEIPEPDIDFKKEAIRSNNKIADIGAVHGFDVTKTKIKNKRQALRNCCNSELGLYILDLAKDLKIKSEVRGAL